jgi:hypothetical protein
MCLLSRGAFQRGLGAAVRVFRLVTAVIVFRSGVFQLWAELPALADVGQVTRVTFIKIQGA